jgi:misacylated tRNA(Ala) deacylase
MGVAPHHHHKRPPPSPQELFGVDAYLRSFDADVEVVDREQRRVALSQTAFYPGGGGQPHDVGTLVWGDGQTPVQRVGRDQGRIWHWLDAEPDELPDVRAEVHGDLDWDRRHLLMRTHTALHVLCGVMWTDFKVAVTGGNMTPAEGRLDFELDRISTEFGRQVERRINEEITRAREVLVDFVDRAEVDVDPALIRAKANLIPSHIDPLRVIDIVGLDKQADGGTHVGNTLDVGRVEVTKTESKGKANKRIRIHVHDPERLD